MFPEVPSGFAALLIVVPPALRWWWGRSLARAEDDPLLPERLQTHNRRAGAVMGTCAGVLVVAWPALAWWGVPLVIALFTIAGFPLRKTLYQETWSLPSYLWYLLRLTFGVFGFWILLAATPWLVAAAGRAAWIAAAALAGVLLLWNDRFGPILRRVLRARPIADEVLSARFDALVARAGIARPRFEYVSLDGGVVANALALPSLRESAVVFSDTVLARFTTDEIVAIAGHELGHLEYYDPARLRKMNVATIALVAIAAGLAPIATALAGSSFRDWLFLWPCILAVALAIRARHRQQHETASDLRAVALTGDADALARALTKLYAIARVPRRWDQQLEQRATHPSLARRIRDIRAAGGAQPAALDAAITFAEAGGPATATFDAAGVSWQRTAGITQVMEYSALVELRLDAAFSGGVSLVAVDRAGQRWRMTPRPEDLPSLQSVLDRVDGRLTHTAPAPPFSPVVTRLVALLATWLALLVGHAAFAFTALLGLLSPSPILLNAGGAAGLAAGLWQLVNGQPGDPWRSAGWLCAALGAGLLALGRVRRHERAVGQGAARLALGAIAALAIAWIVVGGASPVRLHQSVRAAPGAFVLLAAAAAAAWTDRERRTFRLEAGAAAVAAIALFAVGTHRFLVTFGSDPFLFAAPRARVTVLREAPTAQFDIPFGVQIVRLSPGGRVAAVVRDEDEDARADDEPRTFHVAGVDHALLPVEADDFAFIDEARALVLLHAGGHLELRDVHVASGAIVWRQPLPSFTWAALAHVSSSRTWTVNGRDERGRLVQATGTIGASAMRTFVAPSPDGDGWIESWAAGADSAIAVQKEIERGLISSPRWLLWSALFRPQMWSHSQVWRLYGGTRHPIGSTLLDTRCVNDPADAGRLICAAFDGEQTRVFSIDTAGAPQPLAAIDGRFYPDESVAAGWLTGWSGGAPVAIRLATAEVVEVADADGERPFTVAATGAVLGAAFDSDTGSRIRVYPLR